MADDPPSACPVCHTDYVSVSVHEEGLAVNLLENERFRRVCFEPIADENDRPLLRFYHHTHEQVGGGERGTAGGRVP